MKEVKLTQGYVALVDDEDFESVNQYKWCVLLNRDKEGNILDVYARQSLHRKSQQMHRFILGVTDPKIEVDHKDHNGLNNQRRNLRKVTHSQNQHNQKICARNKSGFKGVCRFELWWVAYIRHQGKRIHLGCFDGILDAAVAYNEGAKKYHGEFACLNVIPDKGAVRVS